MSITELAIKRPSLIVVIFTVLGLGGWLSYQNLSYELLPKFSPSVINISTTYPGAAPSEVENSVTKKIENAISTLENIESIKSTSMESFSSVVVTLKSGTDVAQSLQDAQRKVNTIQGDLPDNAKAPVLSKISFDEAPILNVGVKAQMEPTQLYDVVEQRIVPALSKIGGVGKVNLLGGEAREIKINVNQEKLKYYNLSILQVNQAIAKANLDFPTGKIKQANSQNLIRLAGKFTQLSEIEELTVAIDRQGSPIKLKSVAEVQDSKKDIETLYRVNGVNAIGLSIQKQGDANAVAVKELAAKELKRLEGVFAAQQLSFEVAQDNTVFTIEAADAVMHDLMYAVILVAIVMLVFLHSLRNAFIVMLAIPASLISTFIAMAALGFTLNLMTLLALSLVVGILVDDSIVVLENIYRHLEMGKKRRVAALEGRNEIGFTALSITLVDVVIFLPITFVDGLVSDLLRQFSLVVVVSTLLSLFVSFTLTPLLASRFAKVTHLSRQKFSHRIILWIEKQIDAMASGYASLLRWSLNHKAITLVVIGVCFFSSFLLVTKGYIGAEFASAGDRGEFIIKLEFPKDATIEQNNQVTQQVEDYLGKQPLVTKLFTTVGYTSGRAGSRSTPDQTEINVKMVAQSKRNVDASLYANQVKRELTERVPGVKVTASEVSIMGGANDAPIQIVMSSTKMDSLIKYAQLIENKTNAVAGIAESKLSYEDGNPELKVQIDKARMTELGLSLEQVGATMQNAFNGNDDSQFKDGEYEYNIKVMLDAFNRRNVEDVKQLNFINNQGQNIELHQFAEVVTSTGSAELRRSERISSITLSAQVVGRPVGTVGEDIKKQIAQLGIPSSIDIAYDGDLKNQADAFGSLGLALVASIILVYLIMVALYDSYIYPFVVLFSIPVALIGALLALALTQNSLNIFSILGIIMLIGLVAKNAILIVDFANQLKAEGKASFEALIEAGQTRLRPILMTTIAMVIGLLPIAIAKGAGAEWKNGLAWALMGGLTSSMVFTLVLVPVVYYMVDLAKEKLQQLKPKKQEALQTA